MGTLSVVIPAYNEAMRIGATLRVTCTWLDTRGYDSEIVVVDNRSSDRTGDVVRECMTQWPNIRLISEPRPGKGHAVQAGMMAATGSVRLFMDADNSTGIEHVEAFWPLLGEGYDVVIGSLAVPGTRILEGGGEPLWRRCFGQLGNLWIQAWALPGVRDSQRGFKLFSARASDEVFRRLTVFGWAFDIEALAIARARGFRVKEVPIVWNNAPDSKVRITAYPRVLMDTVVVGINRVVGRYET
jgi:dolichyl-phosphate beta-glucosyltransferase